MRCQWCGAGLPEVPRTVTRKERQVLGGYGMAIRRRYFTALMRTYDDHQLGRCLVGAPSDLTLGQASVVLGVSQARVRRMIFRGELPGVVQGNRFRIPADHVHEMKEKLG